LVPVVAEQPQVTNDAAVHEVSEQLPLERLPLLVHRPVPVDLAPYGGVLDGSSKTVGSSLLLHHPVPLAGHVPVMGETQQVERLRPVPVDAITRWRRVQRGARERPAAGLALRDQLIEPRTPGRERGFGALLISPWLAYGVDAPSYVRNEGKDLVSSRSFKLMSDLVKSGVTPELKHHVEPATAPAGWWSGLDGVYPRILITAGEHDRHAMIADGTGDQHRIARHTGPAEKTFIVCCDKPAGTFPLHGNASLRLIPLVSHPAIHRLRQRPVCHQSQYNHGIPNDVITYRLPVEALRQHVFYTGILYIDVYRPCMIGHLTAIKKRVPAFFFNGMEHLFQRRPFHAERNRLCVCPCACMYTHQQDNNGIPLHCTGV